MATRYSKVSIRGYRPSKRFRCWREAAVRWIVDQRPPREAKRLLPPAGQWRRHLFQAQVEELERDVKELRTQSNYLKNAEE